MTLKRYLEIRFEVEQASREDLAEANTAVELADIALTEGPYTESLRHRLCEEYEEYQKITATAERRYV